MFEDFDPKSKQPPSERDRTFERFAAYLTQKAKTTPIENVQSLLNDDWLSDKLEEILDVPEWDLKSIGELTAAAMLMLMMFSRQEE